MSVHTRASTLPQKTASKHKYMHTENYQKSKNADHGNAVLWNVLACTCGMDALSLTHRSLILSFSEEEKKALILLFLGGGEIKETERAALDILPVACGKTIQRSAYKKASQVFLLPLSIWRRQQELHAL